MAKTLKVGIIQQSNTDNVAQNRSNLATKINKLAKDGAELVVLQELHDSLYFCQVESTDNFDLALSIPGEATDFYSKVAKSNNIVLVTSLFEKRAPGCTIIPLLFLKRTGALQASIERCTFLMILHIMKNFTLHLEISASSPSKHLLENWVYSYVGINGIQRQHV